MEKNEENRIQIKNLLETYSIEEISNLFSKIDEKIISLHDCSSKDFYNLNKDFKYFHGIANQISENASFLFDIIASKENNGFLEDIEKFYETLNSRSQLLDYHLEIASEINESILSGIRQSFFPIKNFKQNLSSLIFLESNLQFDIQKEDDEEAKSVSEISQTIKDQLSLLEKLFAKLKRIIKNNGPVNKLTYDDLNISSILEKLRTELTSYSAHYKSAQERIPEIKERTDDTSESISKIITNLQYQDIIKQKMQHIQQTHKDLVAELEEFKNQNEDTSLNEKAKYFIRIRDIAGLQAAQLMQANKEYQNAIQEISGKFLEIGENMTQVSKQCAEYTSFDATKQQVFFESLKKHLSHAKSKIQQFCGFNENFENYIESIREILDKIYWVNKSINSLVEELQESMKKIESMYETEPDEEGKDNLLKKQMFQLFSDVKSNVALLSKVLQEISKYRDGLQEQIIQNISSDQYKQSTVLPDKIESYIGELNKIEKKIMDKLDQNNKLSESMLSDIQTSVGKIQYYDYFEKVISEIVEELNTINFKLKEGDDKIEDRDKNLKHLTENYTMNSEFLVHNQVAQGKDPDMDVEDEEGGDLELF
ncbi:MAG: hypothetical protein ACQESJ_05630 [Bacteroidota bacterium]